MCCTGNQIQQQPPQTNRWIGLGPVSCGCGCIGKDQSILDLKHYQEHLKAELKSVERRIKSMEATDA